MQIERASYEGGVLKLRTTSREALKWVYEFKPGEYEIRKARKRRSLDANALYWELCGRLARAVNEPPIEVYKRHIKDIGNYEVLCIQNKAVDDFTKYWCDAHLGRMVETISSKIPGCTTVLAYYGSSDFDKAQMSRLIDNCIQDCRAVGVETWPEDKVALLKEEWNG